jgi:hypothetical protein
MRGNAMDLRSVFVEFHSFFSIKRGVSTRPFLQVRGRNNRTKQYKSKKKKWRKTEEIEKSFSLIFFFFHIGSTKSSIAEK